MRILAIESSCDETAAAVVEDGRNVLSSVVASQVEEHKLYGGVVPEIASRRHAEAIVGVVQEALDQARLTLGEVEAVAVTHAPGLIGALLVGVNFAKGLSMAAGLPLIPVHHLRSHIAANYLAHPELKPPFLCLVVSGGHSHIVEVRITLKCGLLAEPGTMLRERPLTRRPGLWGCPIPAGFIWTGSRRRAETAPSRSPGPEWTGRNTTSAFPA